MSAYVSFFVRTENDEFVPIGSFCRSSCVYQIFEDYVPYEQIATITEQKLDSVRKRANDGILDRTEAIKKHNKKIDFLKEVKDVSLNERIEIMDMYQGYINECSDEISSFNFVVNFADFLQAVAEDGEDFSKRDMRVYAGIEVYKPTVKDIVGLVQNGHNDYDCL